jgi:hypothetical protein
MKKLLVLCILIGSISLILNACKDETTDPIETNCLLKSSKYGSFLISFDYDLQKRIIKQITKSDLSSTEDFKTYDYSQNGFVKIKSKDNLYESTITLNSNGDAILQKEIYFSGRNPDFVSVEMETKYEYTADRYLSKETMTMTESGNKYTSVYNIKFIDGDLNSIQYIPAAGSERNWNYTYYSDMPNELGEFEHKVDFKGIKSKHLLKTKEEIIVNGAPIIENYSYSKNTNGNIITQIISTDGKPDIVSTLNWDCH